MKKSSFLKLLLTVSLLLGTTPELFCIDAAPTLALQNAQGDVLIAQAFKNKQSNLQVSGQGIVVKILPDDTTGKRHQKFILKLPSGHTLLVAHNIDIAPKVTSLKDGDTVEFYGEYEWSAKGGVLHWTHKDPQNKHVAGWLKHQGRLYQ